jgi:hypothetical protein
MESQIADFRFQISLDPRARVPDIDPSMIFEHRSMHPRLPPLNATYVTAQTLRWNRQSDPTICVVQAE